MKIFVSYSRNDAGDFAVQIYESLMDEHDVFTDIHNIQLGDIWSNTIEKNISACDMFIIIVTHTALKSAEIEKEVLQAQRENKKIIPCFFRDIEKHEKKWGLENIQGIKFDDKFELSRNLYSKIHSESIEASTVSNNLSTLDLKSVKKTNTAASTPTIKSNTSNMYEKKDVLPPSDVGTRALGDSGIHSTPKSREAESSNKERKYTGIDISTIQSKGFRFKIILMPIIVVAIIAVVVAISLFNTGSSPRESIIPLSNTTQAYQFINSWGSEGSGEGQFISPRSIFVDSSGNVYVVDTLNHRIQKFDSNGTFMKTWGSLRFWRRTV